MKKSTIALAALLAASHAFAVNNEWTGNGDGVSWSDTNNWNKARVPDVSLSDVAIIRGSDGDIVMNSTPVTNPQQTWLANSGGALNTLTINNATVNLGTAKIGYDRTGWTGDGVGNGLLTINAGSAVSAGNLEIGTGNATAGAIGVVVLNDGTLSTTQILLGKDAGTTGTLTLNGGAVTTGNFKLASNAAGDGTLNLYGGTLDVTGGWSGTGTDHIGISLGTLTANGLITGKFVAIRDEGNMTVLGGMLDDSAFTSTYTSNSGSFASGGGIAKWGYDAGTNKTAMWSVVPEPATLGLVTVLGSGMLLFRRRFSK